MRFLGDPSKAVGFGIALACLASPVLMAGPLTIGTNWIVNGNAETGTGSTDGSAVSVPGWSQYGSHPLITVVQYQPAPGQFPAASEGPANHGLNFFAGGPYTADAVGLQEVDVSQFATEIDQGLVTFVMSGYFGGWQSQNDTAKLGAYFIDPTASNSTLATVFGPGPGARDGQTGFIFESTSGTIPAGTRTIQFRLIMTYANGGYNDGYADNLSFVANIADPPLTAAPEPGTIGLAFAGGLALAAWSRYRRC